MNYVGYRHAGPYVLTLLFRLLERKMSLIKV